MLKKITIVIMLVFCCTFALAVDEVSTPYKGVTRTHRTLTEPRPLNINVLVIDLAEPTISFKATPSNGDAAGETSGKTVRDFVLEEGAQIGINGGFFFWNSTSGGYDVMGYAASMGQTYSGFTAYADWPEPYVSLNISQDNKADMIYPVPNFPIGYYTAPFSVEVYNAVPGSEWIIQDGVKHVTDWNHHYELHPRTAAGITQDNKLILMTVDGRQAGFSEGMTVAEVADVLLGFGAYQGINLDGGGSTTMYFGEPYYENINVSIDGGVPGQQRVTANNLAVFAEADNSFPEYFIFNDFENGDEGTFAYSPGYSGSTQGIVAAESTADAVTGESWTLDGSARLFVKDDPELTSVSENPGGGWFVRWVSGSTASPSQNITAPVGGYAGFWAKTTAEDVSVSLCIDNDGGMERGIPIALPADGFWHCCQWNLDDESQWQGWVNGDGQITGSAFSLDSIHIFGPNADVELYIDTVSLSGTGSLDFIETCEQQHKAGRGNAADLNLDCVIDLLDFKLLIENWLNQSEYDIDNSDGAHIIDVKDFAVLAKNWLLETI
ncbi:putative N-acetylglucosamine-1-phosphodiester alpha-N-acetylglucosaminidase [Limihaloglobus sulfuriphilus]|uniref:Putative N-acetylglucosamine-1-phosphodiester alpha-N-acetylglucosaminidase n=1 Tax=Limihaloglobus sulfuriphilus TaxID=1851148 RepID=A0A1Q2MGC6_9BACT|nr:phosphodiester glycosidase family protein [Limihaloglobus sulfuriphilus]AQQ71755.1 putative N-acetylglucosamine-1-phosphodiester alpha-N-acetylglucosaminidase [Limihaloglobus sulfuriphilus]